MAEKAIQQNKSGPPINAQKGGADKRNENQARHADAERKRAQYKAPTTCKRKREDGQGWEGQTWGNNAQSYSSYNSGYSSWVADEWSRYNAGTPTQSDADAKWQPTAMHSIDSIPLHSAALHSIDSIPLHSTALHSINPLHSMDQAHWALPIRPRLIGRAH